MCLAQFPLEHERVVRPRLHLHQKAVERRDVDAGRIEAALERLHERGAGAGERIEHVASRPEVAREQDLDQLRYELSEIGMQAMDVPGALALGEFSLRPREREIELAVDRLLGRGHDRLVLCPRLVS